ncbi:hypothetical protein UCREL1_10995 [Eutypa lata UCREL1]|uniref:Pali-domain-containing protein n=1 Tax=Eutypa lata (strain UCR-EL1) TaxID=1287681 RepID=M7S7J5_EUTLA|nr:hypothetical protein UCREL1_10995 [Eutypa lata UCREL1]
MATRPVAESTTGSEPWYARREYSLPRTRLLYLLGLVLFLTAFALFIVVNVALVSSTSSNISLFSLTSTTESVNDANPSVKFGTFGYCLTFVSETPYYSSSSSSSDPDGQCVLDGVGYDPYQVLEEYFSIITDVDGIEASIVRLTRAMAIHPLLAAFSALTVAIAALPCYLPPVLSVATAWVTTVLAVVAVICNFALARKIKESSVPAYNFAYGTAIWCLVAALVCVFIATLLISGVWWSKRKAAAARRVTKMPIGNGDASLHRRDSDLETTVELNELDQDSKKGHAELTGGDKADRHELNDTDDRERSELDGEEKYELDSPRASGRAEMPT